MQNPYLELLSLMKPSNSNVSNFYIAEIASLTPLAIALEGIILDQDDFLINSNILTLNNAEIKADKEDRKSVV